MYFPRDCQKSPYTLLYLLWVLEITILDLDLISNFAVCNDGFWSFQYFLHKRALGKRRCCLTRYEELSPCKMYVMFPSEVGVCGLG